MRQVVARRADAGERCDAPEIPLRVTPIVAVSGPSTVTICPSNSAAPFRASVTDASPITGVVLSWTGPGAGGSVGMTPNGGGWVGGFTGAVNGTWTVIATATDARGNVGRGSTTILVIGCR